MFLFVFLSIANYLGSIRIGTVSMKVLAFLLVASSNH
jgi:hypothetical protein